MTNVKGPASPRVSTIKRLFAATGNQCAFPACKVPAYDATSDDILLEICHIEGAREGAPRYRASQIDEERHGFNNLLLLCGHHHNVIDGDAKTYSVTALREMKAEHEQVATPAASDDVVDQVVTRLLVNHVTLTISVETVVLSQNQMGGQTAHTIINSVPQPWLLSQRTVELLVESLLALPPLACDLHHVQGDPDSSALSRQLRSVLERAHWTVRGAAMLGPNAPVGVQVGLAPSSGYKLPEQVAVLVTTLWRATLLSQPTVIPDPKCHELFVIVGHRPGAS